MKYSRQREMVLKAVQDNVLHPTADCIYEVLKKELPSISLATVYRNLHQLAENKMIKEIVGLDGSVRYDHCTHPHYHFICTKCNKVYDVPSDIAPGLVDLVSAKTGLEVESYDISFKGICPECKKNFN